MSNGSMIAEKHSNFFKKIYDQIKRNKGYTCNDKESYIFFYYIFIQQSQGKTSIL